MTRETDTIHRGNCIDLMTNIPDGSIEQDPGYAAAARKRIEDWTPPRNP